MRRSIALALGLCLAGAPILASAQSAEEILAQFDQEPTVLEVQEAAAAYAHIDQDQMEGWMTRANVANILPRLRGEYRLTQEDDQQDDTDRDFEVVGGNEILTDVARDQRIENDDQTRAFVWAQWELSELIYNPDVLRVSNERSDLVELREDILTTITSLYFERRRAQVQMVLDPPADAVERLRRELEIQELTAQIDALTGGWFSAQLEMAGLPTY